MGCCIQRFDQQSSVLGFCTHVGVHYGKVMTDALEYVMECLAVF